MINILMSSSTQSNNQKTQDNLNLWLSPSFPESVHDAIELIQSTNPAEIDNAFYTRLKFGTAGMRGLVGIGPNRMNAFTVSFATQALASYLQTFQFLAPKVFIGYDSRLNSREFAEVAARVLAANGIHTYLSRQLCPTPFVSFACRELSCHAAIMITASHNPKEYNGFKIYWSDGGQVTEPHDRAITELMDQITSPRDVKVTLNLDNTLIEITTEQLEKTYVEKEAELLSQYLFPNDTISLNVVYTPLHGTGVCLLPPLFQKLGLPTVISVPVQDEPNGDFPTAPHPNPEEEGALKLALDLLEARNADLMIATDPDADRMRAAFRHEGKITLLNGNQIACFLLYFILSKRAENTLKQERNCAIVSSCVTTRALHKIAEGFNCQSLDVLTGFKYIAEKIREFESTGVEQFLFGAEESYGYLLGTLVRDKDGVQAAALFVLAAWWCKQQGKTIKACFDEIDLLFGVYRQKVSTVSFAETQEGRKLMQQALIHLRNNPPQFIGQFKVQEIKDYLLEPDSKKTDLITYSIEGGSQVMIRPSGTEPKIKIYTEARVFAGPEVPLSKSQQSAQEMANELVDHAKILVQPD